MICYGNPAEAHVEVFDTTGKIAVYGRSGTPAFLGSLDDLDRIVVAFRGLVDDIKTGAVKVSAK